MICETKNTPKNANSDPINSCTPRSRTGARSLNTSIKKADGRGRRGAEARHRHPTDQLLAIAPSPVVPCSAAYSPKCIVDATPMIEIKAGVATVTTPRRAPAGAQPTEHQQDCHRAAQHGHGQACARCES